MGELRIRGWAGDADLAPFIVAANAAVAADGLPFAWSEVNVREELLSGDGIDPARDVLVAVRDGAVLGATWLHQAVREGAHQIDHDGFVEPGSRGRGVGRALFAAAETRARELAAAHTDGLPVRLAATVDDGDAAGRRIAVRRGFTEYRWYALMARDLLTEPLPAPVPVPGIEIRPLGEADRRPAFEALAEAFRDHFGHREWTDEMFEQIFSGEETDATLWRIAWDGDRVAGAADNGISVREADVLGIRQGWIHIFGVRRPWRGRGVARWLLAETLAEFAKRGMERAALWVDLDNPTGALGLYESVGFRPLLRSTRWAKTLEPEPRG